MAKDPSHKQWLKVNWQTLLKANVPAMKIADMLVPLGVYNPSDDDYQSICIEPTPQGRVRILLKTLLSKSGGAVDVFKEALGKVCPHVFAMCINPPNALKELDSAARSYYKENLKMRPLTWLTSSEPVNASTFFLNLLMIEKTVAESMMNGLASSSADEIKRQEYLYSQPVKQKLVRLDSLFPQFQIEQRCKQGAVAEARQSCEVVAASVETDVASASASSASPVAVSQCREDNPSCMLQSAQRVGIYGGAGGGKTSCLVKAASMYADNGLWPGARTLLLWKLRDPNVQEADTLKQLLRELKLDLTDEKCEEFADVLVASKGERVILALDGVDELDMKKKGFIRRLLDGSALPKACVLATSRSCSSSKTYFDAYNIKLELLGFSEEQVDKFIEEQLGDKPELVFKLHQVLLANPTIASLMLVPLLAMMVCQVFQLTAQPPRTKTTLYSKLLALIVQRTVEITEGRVTLSDDEREDALMASNVLDLGGKSQTLLQELAKLAFLAHEDGKVVFDHKYVRRKAGCSYDALRIGLLSSYNVQEETSIMPHYSFQHLTVQEFLVAYHLVAHTTSEQVVRDRVRELVSSRHNHVVLQFFAGLIAESLRPHFFACLNQWLHDRGYDSSRLCVCLQCAKEACGENLKDFPSTLQLPTWVSLEHVTAADLTQLSFAVENSQHIERLLLDFDVMEIESETKKMSRVKAQTRQAMTKLMAAINTNKSLRYLRLGGPKYSLFEEEGWRLLVKTVENNSLESLGIARCALDNTSFHSLSTVLKHTTQLRLLLLYDNSLNDVSVCTLADYLKRNNTVQWLDLRGNSYGEESREHLQRQLKHVNILYI